MCNHRRLGTRIAFANDGTTSIEGRRHTVKEECIDGSTPGARGTGRRILECAAGSLRVLALQFGQTIDLIDAHRRIEIDVQLAIGLGTTLLRRDDDSTTCGTDTIQSRSSRALQHRHVLDIIRVEVDSTVRIRNTFEKVVTTVIGVAGE